MHNTYVLYAYVYIIIAPLQTIRDGSQFYDTVIHRAPRTDYRINNRILSTHSIRLLMCTPIESGNHACMRLH
jgi:hypothetical protein